MAARVRCAPRFVATTRSDRIGMLSGQAGPDVGIPALDFQDGGLGAGVDGLRSGSLKDVPATAIPAGIALAADVDPQIAYRYGSAVGAEVRHHGFNGLSGPTFNIMRTPLAGPTYEPWGEDPATTWRSHTHEP